MLMIYDADVDHGDDVCWKCMMMMMIMMIYDIDDDDL